MIVINTIMLSFDKYTIRYFFQRIKALKLIVTININCVLIK